MTENNIYFGSAIFFGSVLFVLLGIVGIVFSALFIETFKSGFAFENSKEITAFTGCLIACITVFGIVFFHARLKLLTRLAVLIITFVCACSVTFYLCAISGIFDKVTSVKGFRELIESFGKSAVLAFIAIQFLQVVILPIPSFITIAAGVLMFGAFYGAVFSSIGIIFGSLAAFFVGRVCGYRVARWIVGEKTLKKGLSLIKGKDKIIFTFMFLFPCFPDDLMCFVAGITDLNAKFFIVMVTVSRLISIFASAYSINNDLIPYDTWWGLILWVLFFVITITIAFYVYKKGNGKGDKLKT